MVCAVFGLCHVLFAVTILVASLRACLASLHRAYARLHIFEAGQNESWCADLLGRSLVEATDEMPPYICIIYNYVCIWWYLFVAHRSLFYKSDSAEMVPRFQYNAFAAGTNPIFICLSRGALGPPGPSLGCSLAPLGGSGGSSGPSGGTLGALVAANLSTEILTVMVS